MAHVEVNGPAPDFSLPDLNGTLFTLSDQIKRSTVLLVFNRGFV